MKKKNKQKSKQKKRRWINQPLIVLSGLVFLIGSILTFYFILRGVYGGFNPAEMLPNTKIIKGMLSGKNATVAVLYSKYTENMLPEGSTWLNDNVTTWKKFLGDDNINYDIIADSTVETSDINKYDLLILPGSRSLSDKEIMKIKKYLINGGSVFATSGIASYSEDGKWRGWTFFSEVFGLNFTKEIDNTKAVTKIHTLRGGLPITANIPTGYPLKVATWDRPIAVEVMDPRTKQVSFWYNYKLENGLVRENIQKTAGIVYGTYGKGRFVWMGFEINSVIGVQEDYVYFEKLFNNSIHWLTYQPIAFSKEWPVGYDAAAVIVPSITTKANNIKNLLPILKAENVKATFFITDKEARANRGLTKSLTDYGEVNPIVDIGYMNSINDTVNTLDNFDTQTEKLDSAKSDLEKITGKKVYGAYPYYGLFDRNTLNALIKDKYEYVITDSLTDRSVPQNIILGDKRITSITKTARDDYEVIRDFGLKEPDFQKYTYKEDLDRILFEGGLYVFKLHTEYQCQPQYVGVVKDLIKDLKEKNFWITTGKEIESWYAKKDKVEIRIDKRGSNRIALILSNPGKKTVDNLVIQVDLNTPAENIKLSTEIIGTKKASFNFDKKANIIEVYINNLEAGESRTYYIDFTKPNA